MIVPDPEFKLVRESIASLSWWGSFKDICTVPPRLQLTANFCIALDDGTKIMVPKGFITDLASIPRILWAVPGFAPDGPLGAGAIVHDFGYQFGYLLSMYDGGNIPEYEKTIQDRFPAGFKGCFPVLAGCPQVAFDTLLRDITLEYSGTHFIANSAKYALSFFGHVAWDNYRTKGPSVYNSNNLGFPGITKKGLML